MKVIRGKRALVTGAASGIGRCIACALAAEGVDLLLVDQNEAGLAQVVGELSAGEVAIETYVCDLADPAQITELARRVRASQGVDILVNCAGVAYFGPTHLMSEAQRDWLLAVNLRAPIQLAHELLTTLLMRQTSHIVNMCSAAGLVPVKRLSLYSATKAGLIAFGDALRAEYSRSGLGVTSVCPGLVRTPLLEQYAMPVAARKRQRLPRIATTTPERVARCVVRAIRRNRAVVVLPAYARLAWRFKRAWPWMWDFLTRQGWRKRKKHHRRDETTPIGVPANGNP